jgi:colanic acid biosynthesis protein WcaH
MRLDSATFLKIVELTPLVSIDLIIYNEAGEVLLGFRRNRPAQDCWFVPGGKILKDERIPSAIRRVALTELGLELDPALSKFKGVYEHLYGDNFAGVEGITTHYIVLAHEFHLLANIRINGDDQHAELRWWKVTDLLAGPSVHENTKAYFAESTVR